MHDSTRKTLLFLITVLFIGTTLSAVPLEKETEPALNYEALREKLKQQNEVPQTNIYKLELIEVNTDTPTDECFEIEQITIHDADYLWGWEKDNLVEPYLHACERVNDLNNLTIQISNHYIRDGYITSRAYIKPQDLSDGMIDIHMMEGRIEAFESADIYPGLIFPFYEGGLLNIYELESGMEQFNRLPSRKAKMTLKPGTKTGYSIVEITSEKVGPEYYGYLNLNTFNMGVDNNRLPIGFRFDWENPLNINDKLTLSLNSARQQNNKDSSLGHSLFYTFPVTGFLLTLGYSEYTYEPVDEDTFAVYDGEGKSRTASFAVGYKLLGTHSNKLQMSVGIALKNNTTFLQDQFTEPLDYKLTVAEAALKHTLAGESYSIDSILQYYKGLDGFGAEGAGAIENTFDKFALDIAFTKYFGGEMPFIYNMNLYAQQSGDVLFGSEQISMGGPYSVRGYKEQGISGDSGAYVRNELLYEKPAEIVNLYPYAALDYGTVECADGADCDDLFGAALGLRVQEKDFNFDIFTSLPLKSTDGERTKRFIGLSLTLHY